MTMLHDEEHICMHCKKKTDHVHHCTPIEKVKVFDCKYCGAKGINHRHMCKERLKNIQYYCINCGLVSVTKMGVCNPAPIEDNLREQWNKVAEETKKEELETCAVCGQPVSPPGHLCNQKYPYKCSFCGKKITKGHHFCKEKVGKAKYDCKICGRIAVTSKCVCAPFKFRDDD